MKIKCAYFIKNYYSIKIQPQFQKVTEADLKTGINSFRNQLFHGIEAVLFYKTLYSR